MARALLPTDAELAQLTTIEEVRNWAGLPQQSWNVLSDCLGNVPSLRVLATLPQPTLQEDVRLSRIPATATEGERALNAVEIIQAAIMWRVARQAYGLSDVDPLIPPAPAGASTTGNATPVVDPSPRKKVKMNNAVDQLDETEVELLSNNDVESAYRNHREAVGADPLPDCDPTPEQITAMHAKVIKRNESPYADFSVMTPYGRRSQKQSKARNFLLQMDGTWKTVEIPGPPTYAAWYACWKVYKSVLLMLKHPGDAAAGVPEKRVVTVAALEEYANKIAELNDEFPEAWHLVLQAEDKCRGEQFERYRRELGRAKLEGRLPMSLSYDEGQPWVGVFCYAARAQDFWDRTVVRPAQTFLDQRTRTPSSETPHGMWASRQHRQQREVLEVATQGSRAKSFRLTVTETRSSFAFAKGALGACPEPCKNQRTHCCQYCLGAHPNAQRTKNPKGQKPGGKGK